MLAPTTIFNTVCSFLTNTNLQHYAGEVHLSYFSQLFFVCWKQAISPMIGMAALVAIIRGLRGDKHMGNFYVDLWRGTAYVFMPLCLVVGVLLMASGMPMTLDGHAEATTLEPGAMGTDSNGQPTLVQQIARGPVAAIVAVKQFGTNGGGFFGVNSAHPFENPNAFSNLLTLRRHLPAARGDAGDVRQDAQPLPGRGRDLRRDARALAGDRRLGDLLRHAQAEPGLTAHAARTYSIPDAAAAEQAGIGDVAIPAVAGLPVDQSLGNLEGKELRFGTAAGATWAALTTNTSNGSVNCMHDSLNPLAGLVPLTGMWLNCIWGGVGVGLINLLIYLIVGVFLAGLMVGRTPEYLGKKVEAREMKLAALALLIHPLMILAPTGLFAATDWGIKAESNPGAHGFSEVLYEFSSASANNGSGFEGLGDTWGFNNPDDNPSPPAPDSRPWDIVMRPGDADQPLRADHRSAWPSRPAWPARNPRPLPWAPCEPTRSPSASSCWARSSWSARCSSCPWPRSGPSPSILDRCRSEARRRHMRNHARNTIARLRNENMSSTLTQGTARPLAPLRKNSSSAAGTVAKPASSTPNCSSRPSGSRWSMLRPDIQWKNPVMFVVEVGTVLTLIYTVAKLLGLSRARRRIGYLLALDFWLVATLLFANFASAIAEARGKAQADALRKTRRATPARRLRADGTMEQTVSTDAPLGRSGGSRRGRQ